MKRGFIRGVWGIYDNSHRITARRSKIDGDMDRISKCKFNEPFLTYVMGEDNLKRMQERGFDCKLINKEPYMFDLIKFQYRHKMEIIRYAMENDGYDEIIWMDWDCVPQKKIPSDFWEQCYKRDVFQACLQIYSRKKCYWRPSGQRQVPNGGFLYIRDKTIPSRAIKIWETMQQDNDELAWAKLSDELMGGWNNDNIARDTFWYRFETQFCQLHSAPLHSKDKLSQKDVCFYHFI